MKEVIKRIPVVGDLAQWIYAQFFRKPFPGSEQFWENRYKAGGNSGVGSYAKFAEFKADVLNAFVVEQQIRTVVEFGSGDGNQLRLATYPAYVGYDVSETAVAQCRNIFKADPTKSFRLMKDFSGETAELSLSLDVIYHLVEDRVFEQYMRTLFAASTRYVVVYASDTDDNSKQKGEHVRHRKFTKWIDVNLPGWKLVKHIPNRYPHRGDDTTGSFADFFIYQRT